jgi:ABC-type amino acid transport substrate-binding protein
MFLAAMATAVVVGASVWTTPAGAQADGDAAERPGTLAPPDQRVTAVMTEFEPFVNRVGDRPSGFYAEIWQTVAAELDVEVEVIWVDSFSDLLSALESGEADVAVAPLTPSAEREPRFDFTSSIVTSGPQLGYHERIETQGGLFSAIFSQAIRQLLMVATAGLLILAHLIWLVERGRDDDEGSDFSNDYVRGIWDGLWWAAVTVTTVGYGDKAPRSVGGRAVALLAMLLSLFLVGAFVSQVTSTLQETREAPVAGLDTVGDRAVGVVEGSSFARYVESQGVDRIVGYPSQSALFDAAADGDIDLVVANPFALSTAGREAGITPVGDTFYTEYETFGVAQGSPWREPINQVLADLQASGEIDRTVERWMAAEQ